MRFDSKNDDLHDPSSYRDMIYFLRRLLFCFFDSQQDVQFPQRPSEEVASAFPGTET